MSQEELERLPLQIKQERIDALNLWVEQKQVNKKMQEIELQYMSDILYTMENGVLKYSNEARRKEALNKLLSANKEYTELLRREDKLAFEIKRSTIEVEYLQNKLESLKLLWSWLNGGSKM